MRRYALFLLALSVFGQQSGRPKLPGEDWVSLFNGKDLTGWTKIGNEKWEVEDGVIHGTGITKDYGYLQTEQAFGDFHLSFKFKCEGDGNSGLFFHVGFKPGTADVTNGPQFEIDCKIGQHTGGVYDVGRQWIVWPSPENETVVRKGEWNEYLLKVEGNHYVSRLNGIVLVDFTDPKPPKIQNGPVALQLHSGGQGNMKFRDIMIRDLSKK